MQRKRESAGSKGAGTTWLFLWLSGGEEEIQNCINTCDRNSQKTRQEGLSLNLAKGIHQLTASIITAEKKRLHFFSARRQTRLFSRSRFTDSNI